MNAGGVRREEPCCNACSSSVCVCSGAEWFLIYLAPLQERVQEMPSSLLPDGKAVFLLWVTKMWLGRCFSPPGITEANSLMVQMHFWKVHCSVRGPEVCCTLSHHCHTPTQGGWQLVTAHLSGPCCLQPAGRTTRASPCLALKCENTSKEKGRGQLPK